jgi:hypothetical protein
MNKSIKFTFSILLMGIFLLLMTIDGYSENYDPNASVIFLKQTQTRETRTVSNAGNWSYWLQYDGLSGYNPILSLSGGTYPRGTSQAIFQDGIVWGGFVRDTSSQNPRVGGQTYNIGTSAGRILVPGTAPIGAASAIAQPADEVQLYRIDVKYTVPYDQLSEEDKANAQKVLRQDVAEVNAINVDDVTDQQVIDAVNQYAADYANWPAEAPRNKDGTPGIANADQVVWFVVNDLDIGRTSSLYGSGPMGIEAQVTAWAYNQPSTALGQVIYKQYKIINKSGVTMDSMFVSQWSDPDLGDSGDDFAGCDTVLSIGFAYNGYLVDRNYALVNLPPPAAGYDFFAGPLVPGVAGQDLNKNGIDDAVDFGIKNLKKVGPGYINLPMTAFIYFAAGSAISDPPLRDYEGTIEWYKMLNGYIPNNGDPGDNVRYTHGSGPLAGEPTRFPLDGDPFRETGDLDGRGSNFGPGDRRIALCSGPFTMEPGDTQEVVLAVVGGIIEQTGGNNRNAVEQMKLNDGFAQIIFDSLFREIPKPPAAPQVNVTPLPDEVTIEWGSNPVAYHQTEDVPSLGFEFQGYNIYQLPQATSSRANAHLIATFDKIDNVTIIRAPVFLPEFKDVVEVPIQFGTDNGIQRFFTLEKDYINDVPLYAGNEYYFVVTAYNYNPAFPTPSLESAFTGNVITVIPQSEKPGVKYNGTLGDLLPIDHPEGVSDGVVQAIVVDPSKLTGHEYGITFTMDEDTNSATYGELFYNLTDNTTGTVLLADLPIAADPNTPKDEQIIDGLLIKVSGPAPGFRIVVEVANANGLLPEDQWDAAGTPFMGNNVWHSLSAPADPNRWYASAGGGDGGYDRLERFIEYAAPRDFEIRFTEDGGFGVYAFTDDKIATCPFEIWDVGISTPDDPSDDHRMIPFFNENVETAAAWGWATGVDPALGYPMSDWIYWMDPIDPSTPSGSYENFAAQCVADGGAGNIYSTSGSDDYYANFYGGFVYPIGRFTLCDYGGAGTPPETGTVARLITNKPIAVEDVFTFQAPTVEQSTALAKEAVEKVNVFPNPYYAYNPSESSRFDRFVTFTHLPRKATIRIFNLGGVQVRKIEKDTDSQFQEWDLLNEHDLPVASGMYIAYIDMPDLGKTKVLKVMIIQGQQIIESY